MIYAVFIGGGIGAVLRYLLSVICSKQNMVFPFHTLVANFLGCFLAGIAVAIFANFAEENLVNPTYKIFIITGFCGGLTTFSTFSIEIVQFILSGEIVKALLYVFLSICLCIGSIFCGIAITNNYVLTSK